MVKGGRGDAKKKGKLRGKSKRGGKEAWVGK